MVKRRAPKAVNTGPTEEQIEAFASQADSPGQQPAIKEEKVELDPNAPRDYKGIKVGFNEYEFKLLDDAANSAGRSKLNFIRQAIKTAAEKELQD